ncbi:MAG: 4-hydroxy-3-methylbut-2-enyl diphosphate reductase, partial [Chitinophagaceae bacterium]
SSNTSHLVELCEEKLPTYFIENASKINSANEIIHFNLHEKKETSSIGFLPAKEPIHILITSGASCPDAIMEGVIEKVLALIPGTTPVESQLEHYLA